jgi:hypothetical protein
MQKDTCILCGQRSKRLGEPTLCDFCSYIAEPTKELWSLLNSELDSLESIDCEKQDTTRFVADLMALGVDHPRLKHLARLCSVMINLVWEKGSQGSIFEIEKEIGTTFDITSRLELMARLGLIEKQRDMITIPSNSIIRKIALPMRDKINEQYRLRSSLFLLGYLTLGALAGFYETNDVKPVKELLGSSDSLDRLPRAFISSLTYVLLQWYDGYEQFYGSELRKRLGKSRVQGAARSDIFGVLAGRDPRRAVSFIKAMWKGFDQIFVFDDYVKRIRERLRERERARGEQ